jgi:hypothetical protein
MEERPARSRSDVLVVASLTLSMISLFVAISGAADAGKGKTKIPPNSVGTKQLKPGAVTASDIAPNAVTSQALAPASVQGPHIAPNAVTTSALAPGSVDTEDYAKYSIPPQAYKPGSVEAEAMAPKSVTEEKLGDDSVPARAMQPSSVPPQAMQPVRSVSTTPTSTSMESTAFTCFYRNGVTFPGVDWDEGGFFDNAHPDRLTAPIGGRYMAIASGDWPATGGVTHRGFHLTKIIGSGPNQGQQVGLKSVLGPPTSDGSASQALAATFTLAAGDYIRVSALTCGADSPVNNLSVNLSYIGKG